MYRNRTPSISPDPWGCGTSTVTPSFTQLNLHPIIIDSARIERHTIKLAPFSGRARAMSLKASTFSMSMQRNRLPPKVYWIPLSSSLTTFHTAHVCLDVIDALVSSLSSRGSESVDQRTYLELPVLRISSNRCGSWHRTSSSVLMRVNTDSHANITHGCDVP